jgi:hypothetical protein
MFVNFLVCNAVIFLLQRGIQLPGITWLTGFDGLAIDPRDPDQWLSGKLREWLASTGAVDYLPLTEWISEDASDRHRHLQSCLAWGRVGGVDVQLWPRYKRKSSVLHGG